MTAGNAQAQIQKGIASYYADKFDGRMTASGEKYNHKKLTAAHKFLPFGTLVRVTNLTNNESVEVKINDRGPFVKGRVIDLSRSAAEKLKFTSQGLTEVEIEVIDASDSRSGSIRVLQMDKPLDNKIFFAVKVEQQNPHELGVQLSSFRSFKIDSNSSDLFFLHTKSSNSTLISAHINITLLKTIEFRQFLYI
jgi:rare lipoprotein A